VHVGKSSVKVKLIENRDSVEPWNFPEFFFEYIYIFIFKVVTMRHSKLVINLL